MINLELTEQELRVLVQELYLTLIDPDNQRKNTLNYRSIVWDFKSEKTFSKHLAWLRVEYKSLLDTLNKKKIRSGDVLDRVFNLNEVEVAEKLIGDDMEKKISAAMTIEKLYSFAETQLDKHILLYKLDLMERDEVMSIHNVSSKTIYNRYQKILSKYDNWRNKYLGIDLMINNLIESANEKINKEKNNE